MLRDLSIRVTYAQQPALPTPAGLWRTGCPMAQENVRQPWFTLQERPHRVNILCRACSPIDKRNDILLALGMALTMLGGTLGD
jgi:hypothetical protein